MSQINIHKTHILMDQQHMESINMKQTEYVQNFRN